MLLSDGMHDYLKKTLPYITTTNIMPSLSLHPYISLKKSESHTLRHLNAKKTDSGLESARHNRREQQTEFTDRLVILTQD